MKIKWLLVLLMTAFGINAGAQTFTFEDAVVPSQWTSSSTGLLSLSTDHYKEGAQSLCWTATGPTTLTATFTSFIASTGNSAYLQIYSPQITNDTLKVEFLYNSLVKKTAVYLLNYRGWHEFNRFYTEYASTLSSSLTSVRFTLKPTSATTQRKIYFDNVQFNHPNDASRIIGSQWVLDGRYFGSTADTSSLSLFANPVDIPVQTPSSSELSDLNLLRTMLKRVPSPGTLTDLADAKAYVQSLNIVRNVDGTVHGNVLDCSEAALTDGFMIDIAHKVEILAAASLSDSTVKTLFQNFVDYLLDQGISQGCNYRTFSNSYTACRVVPAGWLDALPACSTDEKNEVLKLVKWFSFYGMLYYPQNNYLSHLVSDVIYLFTPHMLGIALNQTDDATAVRELKAFKRFMDRNTMYVPGGGDILKPDGTGFHHGTHYNNYMYAYKTWVQCLYYLDGTQFQISADSYRRLKKAIISYYIMGTQDTGDNRYFANALSGRKPFDTQVQFSKTLFDNLIAIGAGILGAQDDKLASAYNYFFETNKYSAPAKSYEGFYAFNYSPTGIFRKSNWVATMHTPTTNFFGAEIYDNTNRFGRYQSDGSLEILYSGSLANSGYATSSAASGGWDWNCMPGATVVQYVSWQEMMPYKSVIGRFDQRTLSKNFSGALTMDSCGMFACDFDQIDTWSGIAFTPTNLVFKKSMYAFGNLIVSLGSSIGSSGTYNSSMMTSTNLFQCLNPSSLGNFVLNDNVLTPPYTSTVSTAVDNWLVSPQGTGYFIPKGNDRLEIRFQNQSTPVYTGVDYALPATTVMAAKAYLNHGLKPSSKSYVFVAVPGTTPAQMQSLASQMANGGGCIYQILAQNSSYHALLYKPFNITAYTFFTAASNLGFGIVMSSSGENLLMDKYDAVLNRHSFAICDPNLHPVTDATYGWIASSSQVSLTLAGEWVPVNPVDGVVFSAPVNGQTLVTVTFTGGNAVYFSFKPASELAVNRPEIDSRWVTVSKNRNTLQFDFSNGYSSILNIRILALNGEVLSVNNYPNGSKSIRVSINNLPKGCFLCRIADAGRSKTIKFIN